MKIFGMDTGPKMTKEQLKELERLRRQVKRGELTVQEARDIWDSKFSKAS